MGSQTRFQYFCRRSSKGKLQDFLVTWFVIATRLMALSNHLKWFSLRSFKTREENEKCVWVLYNTQHDKS